MNINNSLLESYQSGHEPKSFMPVKNFIDFTVATLQMVYNAGDYQAFSERQRTVFIEDKVISTLDFSLKDKEKIIL